MDVFIQSLRWIGSVFGIRREAATLHSYRDRIYPFSIPCRQILPVRPGHVASKHSRDSGFAVINLAQEWKFQNSDRYGTPAIMARLQ